MQSFRLEDSKEDLSGSEIARETAERRELRKVIPQSGIRTSGLTSKLFAVDPILNSVPMALGFALWNRSLPMSHTGQWIAHTLGQTQTILQRL